MTHRKALYRAALAVLVLILALFVADLLGAPDWLGDVASAAWSALAVGAGIVIARQATTRTERIAGWALVAAGGVSLAAWAVDLAV